METTSLSVKGQVVYWIKSESPKLKAEFQTDYTSGQEQYTFKTYWRTQDKGFKNLIAIVPFELLRLFKYSWKVSANNRWFLFLIGKLNLFRTISNEQPKLSLGHLLYLWFYRSRSIGNAYCQA